MLKIQREEPRLSAYAPFTSDTESQILLTCQSHAVHQWPRRPLNSSFGLRSCMASSVLPFPGQPWPAPLPPPGGPSQAVGQGRSELGRPPGSGKGRVGALLHNQQQLANEIFSASFILEFEILYIHT